MKRKFPEFDPHVELLTAEKYAQQAVDRAEAIIGKGPIDDGIVLGVLNVADEIRALLDRLSSIFGGADALDRELKEVLGDY